MHELSVTQSILEIALRHAENAGVARITDLRLIIGDLSSIVDDCVQFYWDIISKGTLAEGATLRFHRIPARMKCLHCQYSYDLGQDDFACPLCSGSNVQVIAGDEFYVESIEVEELEGNES